MNKEPPTRGRDIKFPVSVCRFPVPANNLRLTLCADATIRNLRRLPNQRKFQIHLVHGLQLARRKRLPRALARTEISSLLVASQRAKVGGPSERDEILTTAIRLMVSTGIRVGTLAQI